MLLLGSALASPAAAQSPPASPVTGPSMSDPVVIVTELAEVFTASPDALLAQIHADVLEQTGVAALDPELPAILAALDAAAGAALADVLAEAPPLPSPVPQAEAGE